MSKTPVLWDFFALLLIPLSSLVTVSAREFVTYFENSYGAPVIAKSGPVPQLQSEAKTIQPTSRFLQLPAPLTYP